MMEYKDKTSVSTLDTLPLEIIEILVKPLSSSTVLNLRLVNQRLFNVFSQDKFLKQYLLFEDKQYLSDIRSRSNVPNIEDLQQKICEGEISKILGYLRLQFAHLENWISGPRNNFDVIDILPSTVSFIKEVVDDEFERWLFFRINKYIHAWNVTAKPYSLSPIFVGAHSQLNISSDGKLLVLKDNIFDANDGLIAVYEFTKSTIHLLHKFVFYLDSKPDVSFQPAPKTSYNFHFIVMNDIFIGYNHKISSYHGNLVYFWNLHSCTKIAFYSLSQFDCDGELRGFIDDNSEEDENITYCFTGCKLDIYPGTYQNIIISLRYPYCFGRSSTVSIFNVEKMSVIRHIDTVSSNAISCFMSNTMVAIVTDSHVIEYTIKPLTQHMEFSYGELTFFIECENRNRNNILFKNSHMLLKKLDKVNIISLDKTSQTKCVNVHRNLTILGYIHPKLLLMYDANKPNNSVIKVYNVSSNQQIFTLKNVKISQCMCINYYRQLEYISKLVLNYTAYRYFKVLNF